ncbi:metal transporter [Mycoplasma nasistruthionis]|uniref:Metal transporter n=1 Tax=Mycoplasma nasistruthionis TaxID=353852 RepID=A0A4Y6I6K9_9MOLU|nr:metal transporter [Mycoplasma nasistruthionis]QDF65275.1 metal transporter [Mycoplasma nasistruthionis]
MYAFSTGFFIVLATFGFLRESIETVAENAETNELSTTAIYAWNAGVLVIGLLLGITFSFFLKFVITARINKRLQKDGTMSVFVHSHDHGEHSHPDYIFTQDEAQENAEKAVLNNTNPMLKVIALLLLLTHRIPEGILLGYNLQLAANGNNDSLTIAYFISLIVHLIPEETIFYFRLREAKFSPIQALLLSFLGLSLFLPFMLIGAYAGQWIAETWWLKAIMFSTIAGIFLFTSIVEFIPEFYHRDLSKKTWFVVLISVFAGIIFAAIVLSFHAHSH